MMRISEDRPVAIVGGGLAGLTAANYLRAHNVPIRLFEASSRLAGLASTDFDDEGFTYDFGAHFITNRVAAAVGISAECRDMPRYGESVWMDGKVSSYPFGLMRRPEYVVSAIASRLGALLSPPPKTAADSFRAQYGRALADEIALPLTEAWSGVPAEDLAASVAGKFANSLPRTLLLKLAAWATGRTVAIGYSGSVAESPHVWHVYPEGGMGMVCDKLAETVRDAIRLETPVQAIHVEDGRVTGLTAGGEDIAVAAAVSTAPVHILPKLVRGTDRLDPLARFGYRAMVFVNLKLEGESGLPDVVTWVPETSLPFFRLSDIGAGLPWLVPDGKSLVTCDIGCAVNDATWKMPDEDLGRLCIDALDRMVPGVARRYLGCRVMRTGLAYPVYRLEHEGQRLALDEGTGIEGLISIGRSGEFSHALMEDVYWRSRRRMLPLIETFEADAPRPAAISMRPVPSLQ
jgi:protoporphyrinogen oxidase